MHEGVKSGDILLVDYNNSTFYLGVWQINLLIAAPTVRAGAVHYSPGALKLNTKDIQDVDTDYIVGVSHRADVDAHKIVLLNDNRAKLD